uniref:F-box domain-containing protein n=1 Tax=Oryza nivara TaxID=4536 RepID=A0A0E0H7U9_ORYNI
MVACSGKRRRRTATTHAGRDSSSWASLAEDLVSLIGWRVLAGDVRDYICFRAACHHWRSCTASPCGRGVVVPRFHPRRWMMLPEGNGLYPGHGKLRGFVRFFNLSTGAFVRLRLPIARDDHRILDSVDGILLLQRNRDTAVRLLHPFTGDIMN